MYNQMEDKLITNVGSQLCIAHRGSVGDYDFCNMRFGNPVSEKIALDLPEQDLQDIIKFSDWSSLFAENFYEAIVLIQFLKDLNNSRIVDYKKCLIAVRYLLASAAN